jgi:ABC-2 type transport system permease protein
MNSSGAASSGQAMPVGGEPIPYERLGRPIAGPQALTDDWDRFWHLTFNIARIQWKLRFFGSVLGYFWQLMRPLLLFGVLYVFFTKIGHVGSRGSGPENRYYGVQLLGSIVLFTFFSEGTVGAVSSVVDQEAVVRKIHFPRMVIPLSVVLGALFNLGLNLLVVFAFAFASGVRPMLTWIELPLIVAVLAILTTGLAMLLAAAFVSFRDVQPIWDVVTQILFYSSPVVVAFTQLQEKLPPVLITLYCMNPLAACFQEFRHAVINHRTPGMWTVLGPGGVAGVLAIVVAIFAVGFTAFNRSAPQVAENL